MEASLLGAGPAGFTRRVRTDEFGNLMVTLQGAETTWSAYTAFDTVANNQQLIAGGAYFIRPQMMVISCRGAAARGFVHFDGNLETGTDTNVITPYAFDQNGGMLILKDCLPGAYAEGIQVDVSSVGVGGSVDVMIWWTHQQWAN